MKLQELLNLQDKLDIEIMLNCAARNEKHTDEEILNCNLLELYNEVGEFCNELQSHKYWKHSKVVDDEKVAEELADIYISLFAVTNKLDFCAADIEQTVKKKIETNMLRQKEGY